MEPVAVRCLIRNSGIILKRRNAKTTHPLRTRYFAWAKGDKNVFLHVVAHVCVCVYVCDSLRCRILTPHANSVELQDEELKSCGCVRVCVCLIFLFLVCFSTMDGNILQPNISNESANWQMTRQIGKGIIFETDRFCL